MEGIRSPFLVAKENAIGSGDFLRLWLVVLECRVAKQALFHRGQSPGHCSSGPGLRLQIKLHFLSSAALCWLGHMVMHDPWHHTATISRVFFYLQRTCGSEWAGISSSPRAPDFLISPARRNPLA